MPGRPTHRVAGTVSALLLAWPVSGCSGSSQPGGSAPSVTPAASDSAPGSAPSGLAEMREKLDAAESAAAAEEADAASDG